MTGPLPNMSLLTRYLDGALRDKLSRRTTAGGVRLEDVIRSGTLHPDSAIGVYAPDAQSYQVFGELFEPMLEDFRSPSPMAGGGLGCVNPAAVVSTRIRVARNLAGHAFAAGMTRQERLSVEAKVVRACAALGGRYRGWVRSIGDMPRHPAMVAGRLAFGRDDKYMAAAAMYADWPVGRSVFNTRNRQLSVWINEEDHLRVAVALPGACIAACAEAVAQVMDVLAGQLDFCVDARLGHLTSCPSNVGTAMRASYMVDTRVDASRQARLQGLAAAGIVQVRGASGEHSGCDGGLADVGFRNRYGISEGDMLQGMAQLLAPSPPPGR